MAITSLYCPSCGARNSLDADVCFACHHPLDEPVRETLLHNRYRLLDQLGSGGFGAVHKAEDTHEQGKIVAIKQINLAGLTPQQVIEATDGFNREVSLLSTLSHPHLPHIYEHFTDPDHWYLVMDFLEGETLETYLDKTYTKRSALTPLPLTEVLDIGLQLCTVLEYLHTREPAIIFRDVKPANVMRTPVGKLYLIDFGIARLYKPGKPKDTIPFGSPGYAAPEQYGKAQTSTRSDIYSLGAMLHMLLSGNDPVDTPFHFDPLHLYGGSGVLELTQLIERMVTLDIEQRPERVQEVKDALQRISDAQTHARILPVGVTPPPPPPTQPVLSSGNGLQQMMMHRQQLRKQRQQYWSYNRRKSRRGFVIGAVATGGLLLALGGLTELSLMSHSGGPSSGGAGPSTTMESPDALFQTPYMLTPQFPDGRAVQSVSWSSNGESVALASGTTVRVQEVDSNNPGNPHEILATQHISDAIFSIAWNPEKPERKDTLAFASASMLYIWNGATDSKKSSQLYQLHAQEESGNTQVSGKTFAWSPDGRRIAIPFSGGVQIWDVNTRTLFRNLLFGKTGMNLDKETPIASLSWSLDGGFIAGALNGSPPLVWNVKSGIAYFINGDTLLDSRLIAWSPNGNFIASSSGDRIYITAFDIASSTLENSNNLSNSMAEQVSYAGHLETITSLAWSPDGRYIASGSTDMNNNLHVWTPFSQGSGSPPPMNPTTLYEPAPGSPGYDYIFYTTLTEYGAGITSICWSPNGLNLLVGSDNAYVIPLNTAMM